MHVCVSLCVFVCECVCVMCMCVGVWVSVCESVYVCICVYVYVCMYMCEMLCMCVFGGWWEMGLRRERGIDLQRAMNALDEIVASFAMSSL